MSPKINDIGVGANGQVRKSEIQKNEGLRVFNNNPARYESKIKQNNSTEVSGYPLHYIYSKMIPPRPEIAVFPGFSEIFYRIWDSRTTDLWVRAPNAAAPPPLGHGLAWR